MQCMLTCEMEARCGSQVSGKAGRHLSLARGVTLDKSLLCHLTSVLRGVWSSWMTTSVRPQTYPVWSALDQPVLYLKKRKKKKRNPLAAFINCSFHEKTQSSSVTLGAYS